MELLLDQRRVAEGARVLHAGVDHQGPRRAVRYLAQPAHLLEVTALACAREGRRRRLLRRLLVELALGVAPVRPLERVLVDPVGQPPGALRVDRVELGSPRLVARPRRSRDEHGEIRRRARPTPGGARVIES